MHNNGSSIPFGHGLRSWFTRRHANVPTIYWWPGKWWCHVECLCGKKFDAWFPDKHETQSGPHSAHSQLAAHYAEVKRDISKTQRAKMEKSLAAKREERRTRVEMFYVALGLVGAELVRAINEELAIEATDAA